MNMFLEFLLTIDPVVQIFVEHRAGQRCFELLALIGSPQLLQQSYSPAGQDSWPNWTNLKGLHSGRGFVEHWGGIIYNFTPILPYFRHWGG